MTTQPSEYLYVLVDQLGPHGDGAEPLSVRGAAALAKTPNDFPRHWPQSQATPRPLLTFSHDPKHWLVYPSWLSAHAASTKLLRERGLAAAVRRVDPALVAEAWLLCDN